MPTVSPPDSREHHDAESSLQAARNQGSLPDGGTEAQLEMLGLIRHGLQKQLLFTAGKSRSRAALLLLISRQWLGLVGVFLLSDSC